MARSPVFYQSVGPIDIVAGPYKVATKVGQYGLRWIKVTPDKPPTSSNHRIGYNTSDAVGTIYFDGQEATELSLVGSGAGPDYAIEEIYLRPAADATTFTVQGHI